MPPVWVTTADRVANIEGTDFERFCFELLDLEVRFRHAGACIGGPPAQYVGDQGMDIRVEVTSPPVFDRATFAAALTEDAPAVTCVSCKSGRNWRRLVKEDARRKRAPLDVLREGGCFTVLVNQQMPPYGKARLVSEICRIMASRLEVAPASVSSRISLYDANDLAAFLANHQVTLDRELRRLLLVPDLPGIFTFDEWRLYLEQSRFLPDFVCDEPRVEALGGLGKLLEPRQPGSTEKSVWVFGPPGVGKSRVVFEALARAPGGRLRALVAPDPESGRAAINDATIAARNDIIILVDDCPPGDAEDLAARFRARAGRNSGSLILVGPQESPHDKPPSGMAVMRVSPLEASAAEKLIRQELAIAEGERPEVVESVLTPTEGYPWFVVLLTRALRAEPELLSIAPIPLEAAKIAIAGLPRDCGGSWPEWEGEYLLRAKAMLLVMLTPSLDWAGLSPQEQERLADALGAQWADLIRAAEDCRKRGILRVRLNWRFKYVTPRILARLVATHLLQPPFSLGGRISRCLPELRVDFYRRLEAVEVEASVIKDLLKEELSNSTKFSSLDDLTGEDMNGVLLQMLARWHPASTARMLCGLLESVSIEELRIRTDVRRDVAFALEHISRRKSGFEDAEAALFRLAIAENETWANNATGVWTSLFCVALSLTHRPFQERLEILRGRVSTGGVEQRMVALEGLRAALSSEHAGPLYSSYDEIDGPWPLPMKREAAEAKLEVWRLMGELLADPEPAIRSRAQAIAVEKLRSAIGWRTGTRAVQEILDKLEFFCPQELGRLRKEVDLVRTYGSEVLSQDMELDQRLKDLEARIEPTSYHDRLVDVVGRWSFGVRGEAWEEQQESDKARDRALANEGLAPPVPLLDELEWLESEDAVRSIPFMMQVGIVDEQRVLLETLVERAKSSQCLDTLSAYVSGMWVAGACGEVNRLLEDWHANSQLMAAKLRAIGRLGAADEHIRLVIEDLQNARIRPDDAIQLRGLYRLSAGVELIQTLVEMLAAYDAIDAKLAALHVVVYRCGDNPGDLGHLEGALLTVVKHLASERLAGMECYEWKMGCELLLSRGHVLPVIEAAVMAVAGADVYGSDDEAWRVLTEAAKVEPEAAWRALAATFGGAPRVAYRITLEAQSHGFVANMPADMVMDWVADDNGRSVVAARMTTAHESPLNELARRLLIRFGPDSAAAHALASQAHSTPGVVSSFKVFYEGQLHHAKEWSEDQAPRVAEWGRSRVEEFQLASEREAAQEEFEEHEGI